MMSLHKATVTPVTSTDTPEKAKMIGKKYEDNKKVSMNHKLRLQVGFFIQKLWVEIFFVGLVIIYGGMVFVQMAMTEEQQRLATSEMNILDLTLGSLLLVEILLKIYAFGMVYLRNRWNSFDAFVVIISFGLALTSITATKSAEAGQSVLLLVLRFRIVLRLFRVLVVFERIKQRTRWVHRFTSKGAVQSPLEQVLRILSELRVHPGLHPRIKEEIAYSADVIQSNRLYDTGAVLLQDKSMDSDMQNWLKGEIVQVNDSSEKVERVVLNDLASNNNNNVSERSVSKNDVWSEMSSEEEKEVHALLLNATDWRFDVFAIDRLTHGHALVELGIHVFKAKNWFPALKTSRAVLSKYLRALQEGYLARNPYHNALHAADVAQSVLYLTHQHPIEAFLTPLDKAASFLAAAMHDFKHDGVNNSFHANRGDELAVRYNDLSILESYHVAEGFALMKSAKEMNVLAQLSPEDSKYMRSLIIEMVLGTDMSKHFEDVALFKTKILSPFTEGGGNKFEIKSVGDKRLLLKVALHTADVSNPGKDRLQMLQWTELVVEEFFQQGEQEKQLGLPISPFMDRAAPTLMKQQLGFIDYIVAPMFEMWAVIMPAVESDGLALIRSNREFWKSKGEEFQPQHIKEVIASLEVSRRSQDGNKPKNNSKRSSIDGGKRSSNTSSISSVLEQQVLE